MLSLLCSVLRLAIWVVIAFLTGFSRIYVGLHYPYQVLLGWAVGIFVGWAAVSLSRRILRQPKNVASIGEPSDQDLK